MQPQPPILSVVPNVIKRKKWPVVGIIVGILLMLTSLIGPLGTMLGMARAFETLGASGPGDPEVLASAISETLIASAAGIIVGIPGFILFVVSLVFFFVERSKPQAPPMPQ